MIITELYPIFNSITKDLHARIYSCGVFSSPVEIVEFCEKLKKCLYTDDFFDNLSKTPILIELKKGKSINNTDFFELANFSSFLTSGKSKINNLVELNLKGLLRNESSHKFLIEGEQKVMEFSNDNHSCVYIYLSGLRLVIIHKGKMNYCWDNICVTKSKAKIENRFPTNQYKRLIKCHYKQCLDGERETAYWKTKKDWTLKASPEIIFQKSLASYLNNSIVDGRVLEECLNVNTTDRTDITIITYDLKNYIIEVKWIGKSSGSSYDNAKAHSRSNSGISQLLIYLDRDSEAICGHLVVYDARKKKVGIKWENKDSWDCRIDNEPSIVPLSTKSASTRAKK